MERRLAGELVVVDRRQHLEHVVGRVPIAPRRGRVHRVVRISETHPTEERTVDRFQPFARAIGHPRGGVVFFGELVAPRLRTVPARARRFGLHQPQPFGAALEAVAEQVARVVQAERRRSVDPVPPTHEVGDTQVVAEEHELGVLEAEVRAGPFRVDVRRAVDRLEPTRRQERERGGEVRLADDRRAMTRARQQGRDRMLGRVVGEVDAVARHAVRRRVRAGQNGRPGRLAQRVLRARPANRTPCAANASRFGVAPSGLPSTPSVSARCWSVVISSTFTVSAS